LQILQDQKHDHSSGKIFLPNRSIDGDNSYFRNQYYNINNYPIKWKSLL